MKSYSALYPVAATAASMRQHRRRLVLGFALAVGSILSLALGCAQEPQDAVVSMKGWSLTLDQLRTEYDLINGEGSFDAAPREARESFARTLADKEILLDVAKEAEKELKGKYARMVMIAREKNLVQDFLSHRRSTFSVPEERISEQLRLVMREAVIRFAQLRDPNDSDAVLAELEDGADFLTLARKYGIEPERYKRPETSRENDYWMGATLRVDNYQQSPELVVETLMKDLEDGSILPPIRLADAVILVQFGEYRPIEEADSEPFRQMAMRFLEHLAYLEDFETWTDSLKSVYRFRAHTDAYPIIIDRIAAFRDSITDATVKKLDIVYDALEPPLWSFTPEELRQPVFEMNGKTHTVGDFMESLRSVELEGWPYLPEFNNAVRQLENRLILFPIMIEAEKAGFAERDEYKTTLRRITEEAWLDQYFDTLGEVMQPTEEDIQAATERRAQRRSASEPIRISALTYPESLKSRGEEILERLQAADSLEWFDFALQEKSANEEIEYLPPTEPAAVAHMDSDDPLLPMYQAVVALPAGSVSGLFKSGPHSYSIVRVLEREVDREQLAFEARDVMTRRVHREMREAYVNGVVREVRERRGVRVNL